MAEYEPSPRLGPFFSLIDGQIYMWGGLGSIEAFLGLETFDCYIETWARKTTKGDPPPWLYNGACAFSGHYIYTYGGRDAYGGPGQSYYGSLHEFNARTSSWRELASHSADSPIKKDGCGMIVWEEKLVLFGGYGIQSSPTQPGAVFIKDANYPGGRSNEMHIFNLGEKKWSFPTISGTRPPPCNFFSFTRIDDHRAVLFGGKQHERRTNDVYIFDMTRMHWNKLTHQEGEPCPVGRSAHAAVCLGYGGDHPQLLVTEGIDANGRTLSDIWILDLKSWTWKEVKDSRIPSRRSHGAAAISFNPGLTEVVMFGGNPEWLNKHDIEAQKIANTTILRFELQSLTGEWMLTDVADNSQRGTSERIREKMMKMSQMAQSAAAARPVAVVGRDMEERVREAERRVASEERATRRLREAAAESERRVSEAEERATRRLREAAAESERRVSEAEERATEAERGLAEYEERLRQLETQWVVRRAEIQLTGPELGRGGWATVSVATFRKAQVAAKSIHHQIISPHNLQMFQREMNMAARLRHPNLIQFIGATTEGEMMILTELMPTSLRKELQNDYMPPRQVISIGLDVARALNYLHLMQPDPIIHRDISSANVLLEPITCNKWRAKVSDYGSVNLLQQLQTECPGNPAYSAPEANKPHQQSPKMDIYSYGTLLLEMLTGELPIRDERGRLIRMVHHRPLLALIRRCLMEKKEDRPNASDIISELEP